MHTAASLFLNVRTRH